MPKAATSLLRRCHWHCALLVAFAAGCSGGMSSVEPVPDASSGTGGSADAGDAQGEGGTGCVVNGEEAGTDSGDGNGSPGECPTGLPGPALVKVPAPQGCSYCMDATEVSNAQYAIFLAATGGGSEVSGQGPECEWNTSFEPTPGFGGSLEEDYPVGVDWCDAAAYCKWAGKRLCGRIGGGVLSRPEGSNATESEWYNACSRGGVLAYPYAEPLGTRPSREAFDPSACNVASGSLLPVGAKPTCEGGYPGLFDLSGNISEWENSCAPDVDPRNPRPERVSCTARGASWADLGYPLYNYAMCSNIFGAARGDGGGGIRCCASVTGARGQ